MQYGERTPLTCWRSHSAIANFAIVGRKTPNQKFVAAECGDQHATSVRSPERFLLRSELNGSLAAYEKFFRSTPFARHFGPRTNAIAKTPIHIRGHDETEARRRASAVAGRQMGRVRLHRCRSRGKHEDLAFVDRAGERSRGCGTAVKSNAES